MCGKVEWYLFKNTPKKLTPITGEQYFDNTHAIYQMYNNWQQVLESYDLEDTEGLISMVGSFIDEYYIPENKPEDIKEVKLALEELQKVVDEIDEICQRYLEWDSESIYAYVPDFNKAFTQICKFHQQQGYFLSDVLELSQNPTYCREITDEDFNFIFDLGKQEIEKENETLRSKLNCGCEADSPDKLNLKDWKV